MLARGEGFVKIFFFFASELASDRVKLSEDFGEGILRNNILQLCSFGCGGFLIEFSGNEACVEAADFGKRKTISRGDL